jgi:hypothetical protein
MTDSRWMSAAMAAMVAIGAAGCAQDVGDIDRTQPNRLAKKDLEGVWYFKQTVTDAPAQLDYIFTGYSSGGLEKIRWEIREDYLIAYRAYEFQPGTDQDAGEVVHGGTRVKGADPSGDPSDDAELYKGQPVAAFRIQSHFDVQRAYNTSTGEQSNLVIENMSDRPWNERDYLRVDWSTNYISRLEFLTDMNQVSALTYFVQEQEGGADAMHTERRESGELGYFDFVSKLSLNPDMRSCYYYDVNCIPGEVKVRSSFYRLEELERDYEPAFYDDRSMNKFGYFRTEREVWDRREGFSDQKAIFLANRHDLWFNDYKRDGEGNYLRTADGRRIPTPMKEREPKPVVYYMSPNMPETAIPYVMEIGEDWDRAFTRTVAAAKGMTPAQVTAEFGPMYLMCPNPVLADSPAGCDPRPVAERTDAKGDYIPFEARIGDLRYNLFWWVDQPQNPSGLLGYGPSFSDPETGELISGTAYVYGASIDLYSNYGVEVVKLLSGDWTEPEFQAGADVTEYLKDHLNPEIDPRARMGEEAWQRLSETPLVGRDLSGRDLLVGKQRDKLDLLVQEGPRQFFDDRVLRHQQATQTMIKAGWDRKIMDSEILAALDRGEQPRRLSEMSEQEIQEFLQQRNPLELSGLLKRGQAWRDKLARQNIYMADFTDNAVIGAAKRFAGEKDYQKVWQIMRGDVLRATGAHEVGHTLGLRHNFQGSYDAINFFDKYWDLRKENLKAPVSIADIYTLNAQTPAQIDGDMRGLQYSSIMDYHSRFSGDWAGIGKYDEAAILFAYTFGTYDEVTSAHTGPMPREEGYVETFTGMDAVSADRIRKFDNRRSPAARSLLENWHYATIVTGMGGPEPLKQRDIMRWSKLRPLIEARTADRPVEVPYLFCSDEIRGALVSCDAGDLGADPMEIVQSAYDNYFSYYPLTHFRRERRHFDANGLLNRSYSTMRTFLTVYQQWLIGNQQVEDAILNNYYILASGMGFNTLFRVMSTPQYGTYKRQGDGSYAWQTFERKENPAADEVVVKMGDGRRLRSIYDANSGYYYFSRLQESGHFWDWIGAILVAIEPTARTVAVDTAADREAYMVPFYLLFEDEMTSLFNSQITDNFGELGPKIGDDGRIMYKPAFALNAGGGFVFDPATGKRVTEFNGGKQLAMNMNLTQKNYAALFGIAYFNELYTQHYVDQARVFKLGNGEQLNVDPGSGFVLKTFTDPATGVAYGTIAPSVAVGGGPSRLGVSLVQEASDLVTQIKANPNNTSLPFQLSNLVENINMISAIIDTFGKPD